MIVWLFALVSSTTYFTIYIWCIITHGQWVNSDLTLASLSALLRYVLLVFLATFTTFTTLMIPVASPSLLRLWARFFYWCTVVTISTINAMLWYTLPLTTSKLAIILIISILSWHPVSTILLVNISIFLSSVTARSASNHKLLAMLTSSLVDTAIIESSIIFLLHGSLLPCLHLHSSSFSFNVGSFRRCHYLPRVYYSSVTTIVLLLLLVKHHRQFDNISFTSAICHLTRMTSTYCLKLWNLLNSFMDQGALVLFTAMF